MRDILYDFVDTDPSALQSEMVLMYETITGRTLQPTDPERLFIAWISEVIIRERVNINYIGNQNLSSRAEGENLDALGEDIYNTSRLEATAARCEVRFTITQEQEVPIIIPSGTRVTDISQTLVWDTVEEAIIPAGETYIDVEVECETVGVIGNGFSVGQINTLIDVDNVMFFQTVTNTTEPIGGAEEEEDEEYYTRMKLSLGATSTAGAKNAYLFWAKSVSAKISDVKAILPKTTKTGTLTVFSDGNSAKFAFLGGSYLSIDSLKVFPHGSTSEAAITTDYTVDYSDGLLKIGIVPGAALASATSIDYSIDEPKAGCVEIYAIMDDGTPASSDIKAAIFDACNDDDVRPLTDNVSVKDPNEETYNINLTYYTAASTTRSSSAIAADVQTAVDDYVDWQHEKLGRDINPAKLSQLLMDTGLKRVEITSPVFTVLSDGSDGSTPEVAKLGTITITNGGTEKDE